MEDRHFCESLPGRQYRIIRVDDGESESGKVRNKK